MIFDRLENFKRGWIIGDFEPALLHSKDFEVAIMHHTIGEYIAPHFQLTATEYNVMVSGKMKVNGREVGPGDVFTYEPYEVADVTVLENTVVVCVKTPSVPNDKIMVGEWRDIDD